MNEFSTGVVGELRPLLAIAADNAGNRAAAIEAIIRYSAKIAATADEGQRRQRAENVLIGMNQCGLLDMRRQGRETQLRGLSDLGRSLLATQSDEDLYRQFGKHLLLNLHGADVFLAVRELRARGEAVTKDAINYALRLRGFEQTTNEGDALKMRAWLEKTGVVDRQFNIDEDKYRELTGATGATEDEWGQLERRQQVLLSVLRDLSQGAEQEWQSGPHVKRLCQARFGPSALPESDLRRRVIEPLRESGWLEARGERRAGGGRGGKLGELKATARLMATPSRLSVATRQSKIPERVRRGLSTPLRDLKTKLNAGTTYDRGVALETLTTKLAVLAGLDPLDSRLRNEQTGRAEADVLAEGSHLLFSRWLFQCKNTPGGALRLEDLAREVGLAVLLKAQVIVMVTTGRVTSTFESYAKSIEHTTGLQVVTIEKAALNSIFEKGGDQLLTILETQARDALANKREQVAEGLGEPD